MVIDMTNYYKTQSRICVCIYTYSHLCACVRFTCNDSLISSRFTLAAGYVASPSFLERVCNLVKEVRDQNPSLKFGMF